MSKENSETPKISVQEKSVEAPVSPVWSLIFLFIVLSIIWGLLCIIYYEGFNFLFAKLWWLLLPIFILVKLHRVIKKIGIWVCTAIVFAVLWIYIAGSYNYLRDIICLIITFAVSCALVFGVAWAIKPEAANSSTSRSNRIGFIFFLFFLISFWSTASILDYQFERPSLSLDTKRFSYLTVDSLKKRPRVGLALSGGGYRAALMHAGTIRALQYYDAPVTHVSAVSGGAIIGSFYISGGDPLQFRDLVSSGKLNLTRHLSDIQNTLALPFPLRIPTTKIKLLPFYEFDTTDAQATLLDRIFLHGKKLSSLKNDEVPRFMIGVTDLYEGAAYGFSSDGVFKQALIQPTNKDNFENLRARPILKGFVTGGSRNYCQINPNMPPCNAKLSYLVAASGAFPLAFSAKETQIVLGDGDTAYFSQRVRMADGGITDNSALNYLIDARVGNEDWETDILLSSDASAFYEPVNEDEPLIEFSRAIDTVYANVGVRKYASNESIPPIILLSPSILIDTPKSHTIDMPGGFVQKYIYSDGLEGVEFLIDSLPQPDRDTLAKDIKCYRDQNTCDLQGVSAGYSLSLGRIPPAEIAQSNALRKIRTTLIEDLKKCVETFRKTTTLKARFTEEEASELMRLGQYLVVINWKIINERLTHVETSYTVNSRSAIGAGNVDTVEKLLTDIYRIINLNITQTFEIYDQLHGRNLSNHRPNTPIELPDPQRTREEAAEFHKKYPSAPYFPPEFTPLVTLELSKDELIWTSPPGRPILGMSSSHQIKAKVTSLDSDQIKISDDGETVIIPCRTDKPKCATKTEDVDIHIIKEKKRSVDRLDQMELKPRTSNLQKTVLLRNALAHLFTRIHSERININ